MKRIKIHWFKWSEEVKKDEDQDVIILFSNMRSLVT